MLLAALTGLVLSLTFRCNTDLTDVPPRDGVASAVAANLVPLWFRGQSSSGYIGRQDATFRVAP
jgi:hypothetical protein